MGYSINENPMTSNKTANNNPPKMKKILLFHLVMLAFVAANAQTAHVVGNVVDSKSGDAMSWVNVALMRPADTIFMRGATTDAQGHFDIGDVQSGSYLLRATFMGYQTLWKEVSVESNGSPVDLGKLSLNPGQLLNKVVVSAAKPLYAMDGEKNLYNTTEDPSVQTGTASDALQNAPGVEVDAEGNITLRGVSSVDIWINDRPSHMNAEALKQYIKQLPANAIDRIEVITNPSARYSTKGGVINIVTNQKVKRNELLCVGATANTNPSVSPWVSYVWANEKVDFNFYLNGSYTLHKSRSEGSNTLYDSNNVISRYQSYLTKTRMPYYGGYMGFNMNWNIDSMTHLSAWMGAYPYWDRNSYYNDFKYEEYSPTLIDLGYLDTTLNHGFSSGAYAGAWYEHRFDTTGRKLSFNFNGSYWSNSGYSDDTRRYRTLTAYDFKRHMTGFYLRPNASVGADYTLPLKNNFELEMGADMNLAVSINDDCVDSLTATGERNNMWWRSYLSEESGLSPAVYVTAQKRWGSFTAKLGLRAEGTAFSGTIRHYDDRDITNIDTAFFGLVPSLHLSYQTKDFASYSLSYTRRFSAPDDIADLTLFRRYDDYSFSTGNPNLSLSYTHNLEAAFNKYFQGFGNVGFNAYFRANTDERDAMTASAIDTLISPYLVNYSYPVNIGSSHTEGIEANITYRPTGFFNVRLNMSAYYYGFDYQGYTDGKFSWSARVNLWTKLWNKLEVFANAHYSSSRIGLYTLSKPNKGVDLGFSSDFFDRKMSIFLNVNDVFDSFVWGSKTEAPQYHTDNSTSWSSRFVSLGITFRFGKMELEGKARQGTSESPVGKS